MSNCGRSNTCLLAKLDGLREDDDVATAIAVADPEGVLTSGTTSVPKSLLLAVGLTCWGR